MGADERPEIAGLRLSDRSHLDAATLAEILALIDQATAIEGHRPVGEHKHAHLQVGATGWSGVLAHVGDRLVGYAHLRWNPAGDRPRIAMEVVVHPDLHGTSVAPALLDHAQRMLAVAGGGWLWLWVHRVDDPAEALPARLGYGVQRQLAFMARDLAERPQPATAPEGVVIRPFRPDADDDAFLEVNNAAFAGHPENGGWDRDELRARRSRAWFDAAGLLMAWRGDDPLGFHWTKWHSHDSDEVPAHEPVGEVYVLAVHPRAQGLGLGRVLLDHGLAHLHDRGCRRSILYVDCSNTAALALYEREGFAVVYRDVCYELQVPADPLGSAFARDLTRPA